MLRLHLNIIGLIAGACTTISFIPQAIKILKTRQARDISLGMYVILTAGIFLWLVYGIFLGELPIILANSVAFVLCMFITIMKIIYGGKTQK
ncbi:MAG: SemiSWEET transporter [Candidatus Omnitrophota bacterium]